MLQIESLAFLRELAANNNREWFHSQAKRYKQVRADYTQLVDRLLEEMKAIDPSLASLTSKDCTFRIARDIRFSKDKTPYKTHFGIGMSTYGKRSGMAEYYLHLEEGGAFAGGGIYMPDGEQLKKIRREIDVFHDDLKGIEAAPDFKKHFESIDHNIVLKRSPKDYSEEHPAIDYLKLKSYTAIASLPDALITSKDLIPQVVERFAALKPFLDFLNRGLRAEEEEW